jgi:hypothetical protein
MELKSEHSTFKNRRPGHRQWNRRRFYKNCGPEERGHRGWREKLCASPRGMAGEQYFWRLTSDDIDIDIECRML